MKAIVFTLFILMVVASGPLQARSFTFSPAGCEFSVSFPIPFETRSLISADGQEASLAKAPAGYPTKLSAECWPLPSISSKSYAPALAKTLGERGVKVSSTTIRKSQFGDVITVAGTVGEDKDLYHVRFESYFGKHSKLDLLVLDKSITGSDDHLFFRNSVRLQ